MTDAKEEKKGYRFGLKSFMAVVVVILFIHMFFLFFFPSSVIIKNPNSKYYRAKIYFKFGNYLSLSKANRSFKKKSRAFKSKNIDYRITTVSLNDVDYIEILHDEEEEKEKGAVNPDYLGKYKINAAGHIGYLKLRARGRRVYGTLKFPNWAKGATEYLKAVKIRKGKIKFTRSVKNRKEMMKTGARTYFTQTYYGTYLKKGRVIKGYYIRSGAKTSWEGKKI